MPGLLAFVAFAVAAVIFVMIGLEWEDGPEAAWGFFAVAVGLALTTLPSAEGWFRSRGRE